MKNCLLASVGLSLSLAATTYAVDFNGSYSQDFNGLGQSGAVTIPGQGPHAINGVLGSTGMDGWIGANLFGSSTSTEFKAHNGSLGSSAGRGVVFFGTDGSADRALGYLPTSNQVGGFGVVLTNTSNDTYAALDVSFIGEQWRVGGAGVLNTLVFRYGFGSTLTDANALFTPLDFNAPNTAGGEVALDGNNPVNQSLRSGLISGLNWAPGQSLVLRWDNPDLSGQDNGLAIDNLSLTGVVPAPGALALIGVAGLISIRRRRGA